MTEGEPSTAPDPSSAGLVWLDGLDLDPSSSWLAMGTKALGAESWLVGDDGREALLDLRRTLLRERRDEVLASPISAAAAVAEVVELVAAEGVAMEAGPDDALVRIGRSIVEDVIILRRGPVEWEFEAGVLCFPSRWRLHDKLGRPLRDVHGPTPGYDPVLADRITSLLDRLGDRKVRRRNWFVHPDPALFQPDRPAGGDPLVPAEHVLDGLFVRSERQTLRSLPKSQRVLFTIATQQCSLREMVADDHRRTRLLHYLEQAPPGDVAHRGLSPEQVLAVRAGLS